MIRSSSDLDLLVFLRRHDRVLLLSETLAQRIGATTEETARSLDALIKAGAVTQREGTSGPANLYSFVEEGASEGILGELLMLASTREGRMMILQALVPEPAADAMATSGDTSRNLVKGRNSDD